MTEQAFWALIEAADMIDADGEASVEGLDVLLRRLPDVELLDFQRVLQGLLARAYRWDVWGAAYLLNGGCSDDGFDYFRAWLIANGREAFERVLSDPDALVELAEDEAECPDLLAVAPWIFQERTGDYPKLPATPLPDLGTGWDFDDPEEMKRRYPRLSAAFGG
ncbi:MAG: DUF4240 domain-containing protein [Alphaproteobacteria bacterium]|nr:DUF4240 domain-containing protein [Alphaproteobacteria bacterium]